MRASADAWICVWFDGRRLALAVAVLAFAVLLQLPLTVCADAQEQKALRGVALVIGQSEYEHLSPLPNPENDADAIETLLADLGFDSVRRANRNAETLARDLERFAEDAEDADVAVVYYSGHGIEAGGDNFLVPVDADLSALDDAGEKLVPVSALLEKLKATVPVAIVMLDACRDNPFPPGSLLRVSPGDEAVAVGTTGLSVTRGAASLKSSALLSTSAEENVGTVISFAAEPGKVALDGDAGGNSPYAAALLRHFEAMAGEEFGIVMRMVAEEVYLKTGGRQRPWINESLRRLLYFGDAPAAVEGPEGDILRERRQLLVTISALPDPERRSIEKIAANGGVPMDAIYGMLKALGADAPKDPAELEALLQEQTERIRKMQADRATIQSTDPEIARLAELADQAISEGALETAVKLNGEAKARVAEIESTVADAEADIKARRLEFAEVYARSGKTAFMTFDYEQSATDYEQAFRQVERWDDWSAWSHRGNQAVALQAMGWRGGQTPRLDEALDLAREVVRLSEPLPGREEWALSQVFLGNTLITLGQRRDDMALLREAVAAYEAALGVVGEDGRAFEVDRPEIAYNLAGTKRQIAFREKNEAGLVEAGKDFAALAEQAGRDTDPKRWARARSEEASVSVDLGRLLKDVGKMRQAVAILEEAMEVRRNDADPDEIGELLSELAVARSEVGIMEGDHDLLVEAGREFGEAIPTIDKTTDPVTWSTTLYNRAINSHNLYVLDNDPAWLESAIADYRAALTLRDRTLLRRDWADAMSGIGGTTVDLGHHRKDVALIRQGRQAHLDARAALDPAVDRDEWLRVGRLAADALRYEAEVEGDPAPLDAALAELTAIIADAKRLGSADNEQLYSNVASVAHSYATIIGKMDRARALAGIDKAAAVLADGGSPGALAAVNSARGRALYSLAVEKDDAGTMRRSVEAYRAALVPAAKIAPHDGWAVTENNLALALRELSRMEKRPELLPEVVAAWREAQAGQKDRAVWLTGQRSLATVLDEIGTAQSYAEAAAAWGALLDRTDPDAAATERGEILESRARSLHNQAAFEADATAVAAARRAAIADYRAALALFGPGDQTAATRIGENLADLLKVEGETTADVAQMQQAADLYANILASPARSGDGATYKRARLKEAATLVSLSFATGDAAAMDRARRRYESGYGPRPSPEDAAADWANAATYGVALRTIGMRSSDVALYRRSVEVLAIVDKAAPQLSEADRAWLDSNRAESLSYLAEATKDTGVARDSVALWRKAIVHYTPEAYPAAWRGPLSGLAAALLTLGGLTGDASALEEAASIYGRIVTATDRDAEALTWAGYANGQAYAVARSARLDKADAARLADAEVLIRAARDIAVQQSPDFVPAVDDTLCGLMIEAGRIAAKRAAVEEALRSCDASLAGFKTVNPAILPQVEETIARGRQVLAAMD